VSRRPRGRRRKGENQHECSDGGDAHSLSSFTT
jgi:hypothetical protein